MNDTQHLISNLMKAKCHDKGCDFCPLYVKLHDHTACSISLLHATALRLLSENPLPSLNEIAELRNAETEVIVTAYYFIDTGEAIPAEEVVTPVSNLITTVANLSDKYDTIFVTSVDDYVTTPHDYYSIRKVSFLIEKGEKL